MSFASFYEGYDDEKRGGRSAMMKGNVTMADRKEFLIDESNHNIEGPMAFEMGKGFDPRPDPLSMLGSDCFIPPRSGFVQQSIKDKLT